MAPTVASTNNAPFSNPSVPRVDQRPARVVDHAQRSAVSLAVVSAPASAVVLLGEVKGEEGTYTARGLPPKTISLADNATAQGNESNGYDRAWTLFEKLEFVFDVVLTELLFAPIFRRHQRAFGRQGLDVEGR